MYDILSDNLIETYINHIIDIDANNIELQEAGFNVDFNTAIIMQILNECLINDEILTEEQKTSVIFLLNKVKYDRKK